MAEIEDLLSQIVNGQVELLMRVAEVERRNDTMFRHGKVTDVDTEKQVARIEIGERDGKPVKSAWVPYGQIAGAYKSHQPPSVGQQMTMFAPNGEVRQAVLLPFTWSDENKSPSDKADEHVDTFGDKWKWTRKKDLFHIELDKTSIEIKPGRITIKVEEATIVVEASKITLKVSGAEIELTSSAINAIAAKIFTVGKTFVGMDSRGDESEDKLAIVGDFPTKQAFSKKD